MSPHAVTSLPHEMGPFLTMLPNAQKGRHAPGELHK